MTLATEKLLAAKSSLEKGVVLPSETVRTLLLWFGAKRRGYNAVKKVRASLGEHGLVTA